MEQECRRLVNDARRGKNMFALGMLCHIYSFDLQIARDQIVRTFRKKSQSVIETNWTLLDAGYEWARANLDLRFRIPVTATSGPQIVTNGNTAIALGVMASGMELCAMYPITPATSASHYLSDVFEQGRRHRAPGRGRDRGLCVRHRRLVRGQVHGHDHLRTRATRSSRRPSGSR